MHILCHLVSIAKWKTVHLMYRLYVYIYNGVDEVPMNVTHVRVDPTVTIIPDSAFEDRGSLKEVRVG